MGVGIRKIVISLSVMALSTVVLTAYVVHMTDLAFRRRDLRFRLGDTSGTPAVAPCTTVKV